jgi:hypothetical protein
LRGKINLKRAQKIANKNKNKFLIFLTKMPIKIIIVF